MNKATSNDNLLHALSLLMTPCGTTIEELAQELDVTERTIYRIKNIILKKYPNLEKYQENGKNYFRLPQSEETPQPPNIKPSEVANIDSIIRCTTNVDHKKSLKKIRIFALNLVKKSNIFNTDYSELNETETTAFTPHIKLDYDCNIVETIRTSILSCNTVDISYKKRSSNEEFTYKNYLPLGIIWGGRNYLLTRSKKSKKPPFLLALTNIIDIKQTDKFFNFPLDCNVKEYTKNMFGVFNESLKDYELIFYDHNIMGNINEYHIHNNQTVTKINEKETKVTFKASGVNEVFNFISQWEDKVKIISPQELKDKVLNTKLPIVV